MSFWNFARRQHSPHVSSADRVRRAVVETLESRCLLSADLVRDINAVNAAGSDPSGFTGLNGAVIFAADDGVNGKELWKTDGTAAGTVMLKDINLGASGSDPSKFINVNGTVFFSADDGTHGVELWKTDGTAAGTVMVKNVAIASDSSDP